MDRGQLRFPDPIVEDGHIAVGGYKVFIELEGRFEPVNATFSRLLVEQQMPEFVALLRRSAWIAYQFKEHFVS
jgi:hypothetical protein